MAGLRDIDPSLFEHDEEWALYLWMISARERMDALEKREDWLGMLMILTEIV